MLAAVATSNCSPWRNSWSVAAITSSSSTIRMRPRVAGGFVRLCRPVLPLDHRRPHRANDSSPTTRVRRDAGRQIGRASPSQRGRRRLQRQPDDERGALPRLRAIAELTRDVLEDLPADEQPQPGAMRLGGEERLEEPAAVGQRDPPAVVLDGQDQPVVPRRVPRRGSFPWSSVASIALSTRFRTTCVR